MTPLSLIKLQNNALSLIKPKNQPSFFELQKPSYHVYVSHSLDFNPIHQRLEGYDMYLQSLAVRINCVQFSSRILIRLISCRFIFETYLPNSLMICNACDVKVNLFKKINLTPPPYDGRLRYENHHEGNVFRMETVDNIFSHDTVEEIIDVLIQKERYQTLDKCLIHEYRLTSWAISCQISSDFCEVDESDGSKLFGFPLQSILDPMSVDHGYIGEPSDLRNFDIDYLFNQSYFDAPVNPLEYSWTYDLLLALKEFTDQKRMFFLHLDEDSGDEPIEFKASRHINLYYE
ncbi:hypothetical protein Tco_0093795 [Tanacetum coccineum]